MHDGQGRPVDLIGLTSGELSRMIGTAVGAALTQERQALAAYLERISGQLDELRAGQEAIAAALGDAATELGPELADLTALAGTTDAAVCEVAAVLRAQGLLPEDDDAPVDAPAARPVPDGGVAQVRDELVRRGVLAADPADPAVVLPLTVPVPDSGDQCAAGCTDLAAPCVAVPPEPSEGVYVEAGPVPDLPPQRQPDADR